MENSQKKPSRRKKRMKLPNNFGSIKYLGDGRRRPYGVYPPATEYSFNASKTPKALAYTETWEDGYEILTTYNLERAGKIKVNRGVYIDRSPLFSEVYEKFFDEKFNKSAKKLSVSSRNSTTAAYNNCSALHDMQFAQIKYDDLQNVINNCPLRHASLELIVSLMHQMYKYALKYEIVEKDYSQFLYIPIPEDDESGVPFSDDDLIILWKNKNDPVCEMLLIMCYSGFRIAAFKSIEVNLEEKYFKGGVKTDAGKNRIVPIHSAILELVKHRYRGTKNLLADSDSKFRKDMYETLERIGIKKHTPHDCRHTFSMLCERYSVNENDRKRMMGHSFGSDLTNAKYSHRTVEELREQIEKINPPMPL